MSPNLVGRSLLGQYRVESFVAAGGMGEVYKAWDQARSVYLAMKVLRTELDDDETALRRFRREADALQKLAHPNIVPFYGLFEADGTYFLLERFVDGDTLGSLIRSRKGEPFPVMEALVHLKALCAALGYAHAQGVIHCDVKPANLMIDNGGMIFLTDFGIARYAGSTTTTLGPAGTPAYMAPEQIRGEGLTPAADIYAIGLILFEMLTGQRPFHGNEPGLETAGPTPSERIRAAHLTLPPPDPRTLRPELPAELARVILRSLAKDPAARYPSAGALLSAAAGAAGVPLEHVSDRAAPSRITAAQPPADLTYDHGAGPLPQTPSTRVPGPRSKRLWWLTGGLAIIAAVVALVFLGVRALLGGPASATPAPELQITQAPSDLAAAPTSTRAAVQTVIEAVEALPAATIPATLPASGQKDGMEMIEVPGGDFQMGAASPVWPFEGPAHSVMLNPFRIDKTEVTNAMFAQFVNQTGYLTTAEKAGVGWVYTTTFAEMSGADWRHPHGPASSLAGRDLFPVVQVSWEDAQAYCTWAGRRLPSEAEWEKAARGENGSEYPWGQGLSCDQANYHGCVGDAVAVGSYPAGASPYGVLDMAGNVWEWVADFYADNYYSVSPSENPSGPATGEKRVHRGGGWYDSVSQVRSVYRYGNLPSWSFNSVGIRCAQDP